MEKFKNAAILVLIVVISIVVAVIIPAIPAYKFYQADQFIIPSNVRTYRANAPMSKYMADFVQVRENLQTQEAKDTFEDYTKLWTERGEISFLSVKWLYVILGITVGVLVIAIGIILKYKSSKRIYSLSFILSGILIVIFYIFIFSVWQLNFHILL